MITYGWRIILEGDIYRAEVHMKDSFGQKHSMYCANYGYDFHEENLKKSIELSILPKYQKLHPHFEVFDVDYTVCTLALNLKTFQNVKDINIREIYTILNYIIIAYPILIEKFGEPKFYD